jgi:hypothetical protein
MWMVRFSEKDVRRGTFEQLQQLAAKGRIQASTPVRAPDSTEWVPAESVLDLFPEAEFAEGAMLADVVSDPLARSAPAPQQPAASKGVDPKVLMIAGMAGGGVLALIVVVVVAMSMMRRDSTSAPVAVVPTTHGPVFPPSVAPPPVAAPPVTLPPQEAPDVVNKRLVQQFDQAKFLAGLQTKAPKARVALKHTILAPAQTPVTAVALSRNVSRAAIAYGNGQTIVYDVHSGARVSELAADLKGPCPSLALSSDGAYLLLGGAGRRGGLLVKTADGAKVVLHSTPVADVVKVAISADDKFAVLITSQGEIHRFPLLGGAGMSCAALVQDRQCQLHCIAPDASWAAVGIDAASPYQVQSMPAEGRWPDVVHQDPLEEPIQFMASRHLFMTVAKNKLWVSKPPPGRMFRPWSLRSDSPLLSAVSADDRYLFLCDKAGRFEVRPLEAPLLRWWSRTALDRISAATMSMDARTFLFGSEVGYAFIMESPATPEIDGLGSVQQGRALLAEKQYEKIESLAEAMSRQDAPLRMRPNQSPINVLNSWLFHSPDRPTVGWEQALEQWIEARPDADLPKLLLAEHYIHEAWRHRGNGFANTVTPEGWKGFHEYVAKTEPLLLPVCAKEKPLPMAYELVITLAMAQGWPRERWQPYADRLKAEAPGYVDAHSAVMMLLLRRWHGGPDDCVQYATDVADTIGGPAGDVMYARLLTGKAGMFKNDEEALAELRMDGRRALRGLLLMSQTNAEKAFALHWGLRLSTTGLKDRVEARKFYDLLMAEQLFDEWESNWYYEMKPEKHVNFARHFALGTDKR